MTNFDPIQFEAIWEGFKDLIESEYNTERGRKSPQTAKDVLFMTLAVLKHGGHWDFMAKMFDIKPPTFERLIQRFIALISDPVHQHYVEYQAKKWKMKTLNESGKLFKNYPMARYATDVTFQPCNRPSGNIEEGKRYFSKKHGMYGYKVEVSLLPNGLAIGCSAHEPGSVSDLRIFQDMQHFHRRQMHKLPDELQFEDDGPFADRYAECWAVLLDKGYQGSLEFCRGVHPTKKPKNGVLTPAQTSENRHIPSDRVIVENYFGRMCGIWNVVGTKWKWGEKYYDEIFRLCMGLTNFHIMWNPLRAEDGKLYHKMINRWYKMGSSQVEKRKQVQSKYREKRRRRVEMQFRANGVPDTEDE